MITCEPALNELVLSVAWLDPDSVDEPTGVPSTVNATVPLGAPAPGAAAATVAVNVTDRPNVDEPDGLAVSVVVVDALLTVYGSAVDAPPNEPGSPL